MDHLDFLEQAFGVPFEHAEARGWIEHDPRPEDETDAGYRVTSAGEAVLVERGVPIE